MKKRLLVYLTVLAVIVVSGVCAALVVPRLARPVPEPPVFDKPWFPMVYNISEVTALMRKEKMLVQFCYLPADVRFSEPEKLKCFQRLLKLGLLEILKKKPEKTSFTAQDYIEGIQTLIALTDLAVPYMKHELGQGRRDAAEKVAVTLTVTALNYPRGSRGNLHILRRQCAELLLLLDQPAMDRSPEKAE